MLLLLWAGSVVVAAAVAAGSEKTTKTTALLPACDAIAIAILRTLLTTRKRSIFRCKSSASRRNTSLSAGEVCRFCFCCPAVLLTPRQLLHFCRASSISCSAVPVKRSAGPSHTGSFRIQFQVKQVFQIPRGAATATTPRLPVT